MLATYIFGLVFVSISWALAGVDWHSTHDEKNPKNHIEKLYRSIGDPRTYDMKRPLDNRGNVFALWNVGMVLSVAILLGTVNFVYSSFATVTISALLMLCLAWRIFMKIHGSFSIWPILLVLVICAILFFKPKLLDGYGLFIPVKANLCILISCIYISIFIGFRTLNYEKMLDPLIDLRPILKTIIQGVTVFLLGTETARLLSDDDSL